MKGKTVLLCSGDAELRESLANVLACAGNKTFHAPNQFEAISTLDGSQADLAIVDVTRFPGAFSVLDLALGSVPTIAITPGHDLDLLSSLVCSIGVSNVMARSDDANDGFSELIITAEKLLRNDLFGLDKYISGSGARLRQSVLTSARDRDTQIGGLSEFLKGIKAPRHLVPTIANAADEMLTNAMYNAPVDDSGKPRYASTDRRSKIHLEPSEHVALSYGLREGMFGISVTDQFGRLRHEHLSQSIERCVSSQDPIEQKAGGAGLGLFLIARTAHQFIINVDPDQRTEVIALWDLDRRRLKQRRAHHSLHYFERAQELQYISRHRRAAGTRAPVGDWDRPATNPGYN